MAIRKGDSSWNRRTKKGHFKGQVIPFGASVRYRVADRKKHLGEFDVPAQEGVFVGYELHPGSKWKHEYLVVPLKVFEEDKAWQGDYGMTQVIECREVLFDTANPVRFPLKEAYDKAAGEIPCPPGIVQEARFLGQMPYAPDPTASGGHAGPSSSWGVC